MNVEKRDMDRLKIAIVGTGITGLGAAWLLNQKHYITVFEKQPRIGGHSNTIEAAGFPAVDTGFIVYNEWTYPNLIALFDYLGVQTEWSDMSFAVSMRNGALEYSGDHLFVQKRNVLRLSYWRMLYDLLRFYRSAPKFLEKPEDISLGDYLARHNYSRTFIDDHLMPMTAAIWSMSAEKAKDFPAKSFIRFFVNHGLLKVFGRPEWRTVTGGSREYVAKLSAPFADKIRYDTPVTQIQRRADYVLVNGERFDHVVFAGHSDETLAALGDQATEDEKAVLGAFPYKDNIAYLHQDEALMPRRKKAWSSWNYLTSTKDNRVVLTYWMNRLQKFIPADTPLFVTLNPKTPPAADKIIATIPYAHPQYTMSALAGWDKIKTIQGKNRTWFCGAWCGYGFHEDGLSAGLAVAEALGGMKRPWSVQDSSPAGENARPE